MISLPNLGREKRIDIQRLVVMVEYGKHFSFVLCWLSKDRKNATLLFHYHIGFYMPPKFSYEWIWSTGITIWPFTKKEGHAKYLKVRIPIPAMFYKKQQEQWNIKYQRAMS